ncbi:MAG: HAD family hydrolase, partial [Thermoplasmata archaeon]|nr:HAD family hydrolase [Thermoplasmata archaeon]
DRALRPPRLQARRDEALTGRDRAGPPHPSALLVDLWNTLLVPGVPRPILERERARPWIDACRAAGLPEQEAVRRVHGMLERGLRIQARGRSVPLPEQARLLGGRIGERVDLRAVETGLLEHAARLRVEVADGALAALGRIRSRSLPIGLVSNILSEPADGIRGILGRTGLDRRLDAVYLSIEHRTAKPSTEPFRSVLRTLGAHASQAVHVGDMPEDILGAHAAGVAAIRFTGFLARGASGHGVAVPRLPPGVPSLRSWVRFPERLDGLFDRAVRARVERRSPSVRPDRRTDQASA